MARLLKGLLIIAAIAVVARVLIERLGGPGWLSSIISTGLLICVIGPVYFALRVVNDRHPHPYRMQIAATAMYAVLVRAMIIPVYWLAFYYQWPEARFSMPVPDPGPLVGYIVVPFATAAFWILGSVVIGGGIGALMIALRKRPA